MKIINLFALILIFCLSLFGQNADSKAKPEAVQIDSYAVIDLDILVKKIELAVDRLAAEPSDSVLSITINPGYRIEDSCLDQNFVATNDTEKFVRRVIDQYPDFSKRITIFIADYGDKPNVRFWLVPAGADAPRHLDSGFHPPCCCVAIVVVGRPSIKATTNTTEFFVKLPGYDSKITPSYIWTVSSGKIIKGQGTDEVTVDTKGLNISEVIAVVEIGTNPACNCPTKASYTTKILKDQ